eukprot:853265-Prorocentrum_minimum.AAC.1
MTQRRAGRGRTPYEFARVALRRLAMARWRNDHVRGFGVILTGVAVAGGWVQAPPPPPLQGQRRMRRRSAYAKATCSSRGETREKSSCFVTLVVCINCLPPSYYCDNYSNKRDMEPYWLMRLVVFAVTKCVQRTRPPFLTSVLKWTIFIQGYVEYVDEHTAGIVGRRVWPSPDDKLRSKMLPLLPEPLALLDWPEVEPANPVVDMILLAGIASPTQAIMTIQLLLATFLVLPTSTYHPSCNHRLTSQSYY